MVELNPAFAGDIPARVAVVEANIEAALRQRGGGSRPTLIAVSKRHPVGAILAARRAGLRHFGENYAQEMRDKVAEIHDVDGADGLQWHFIGGLQSNKAKLVVGRGLIHTVDRLSLLKTIEKLARQRDEIQEVLVEVNFGEAQKSGVLESELPELLQAFASCERTRCVGLMCIPPRVLGPDGHPLSSRSYYARMAMLRLEFSRRELPGVDLRELSMGMSNDYAEAILEGATMIRVGTALFGPRPTA